MLKLNICFNAFPAANLITIILFPLVHISLTFFVVFFLKDLYAAIYFSTGGLVQGTIVANFILMLIVIGGVLFWFGRLTPRDVGLRLEDIKIGLVVTVGIWGTIQLIGLGTQLVLSDHATLEPEWSEKGIRVMIGALSAQLFGNALQEEISFRGFLFAQLVHLFKSVRSKGARIALALLISQSIFALMHIPIRVFTGMSPLTMVYSLLTLFFYGTVFALIYCRTGNLFVAIGIHTLHNNPASLFLPKASAFSLLYPLVVIVLLVWPWLTTNDNNEVKK